MNILYLCDEYPPGEHGGIGTAVQLLAREMVKQGHKVIVAGLYIPGYGGEDEFDDEGVKVYRFRMGMNAKWFGNKRSVIRRIGSRILKDTGIIQRNITHSLAIYKTALKKLIDGHNIAVVEMPDYNDYIRFCNSFVPFPELPVPVIVKMNGTLTYFAQEANKHVPATVLKMEQAILNQASAVAAASRYSADKSAACLSYTKPIEILYNGIDTAIRDPDIHRNPEQVIFTGSLVAKKGVYQLAKAWNLVNAQIPNARLLILGKGPQQKVADLLNEHAKGTVTFMGHVDKTTLYSYLFASAISVFPSYAEAFALAPLEAMACGTAVINSNRTSGPELIDDNINGLLIDPDNIEQIAAAILSLLNDNATFNRLAKAGNNSVKERFEISKIAKQHLDFYKKVIDI